MAIGWCVVASQAASSAEQTPAAAHEDAAASGSVVQLTRPAAQLPASTVAGSTPSAGSRTVTPPARPPVAKGHSQPPVIAAQNVPAERHAHIPAPPPPPPVQVAVAPPPANVGVAPSQPPAASAPSAPPAGVGGDAGGRILAQARAMLGVPYVDDGATPSGFDCSGYTMWVYSHAGVASLPHNSEAQRQVVRIIPRAEARPGDMIFYLSGGSSYHVAIYAGGNQEYAAPAPGQDVKLENIWDSNIQFGTDWH